MQLDLIFSVARKQVVQVGNVSSLHTGVPRVVPSHLCSAQYIPSRNLKIITFADEATEVWRGFINSWLLSYTSLSWDVNISHVLIICQGWKSLFFNHKNQTEKNSPDVRLLPCSLLKLIK